MSDHMTADTMLMALAPMRSMGRQSVPRDQGGARGRGVPTALEAIRKELDPMMAFCGRCDLALLDRTF